MNIIGLDGINRIWNISACSHPHNDVSKYHQRAKDLLKDIFPFDIIYEEVTLPGSKYGQRDLVADFVIPRYRLVVEVQGEQHYKFNSYMHSNKLEFARAKIRDANKVRWCSLNNLTLIQLSYKESNDDWRRQINNGRNI